MPVLLALQAVAAIFILVGAQRRGRLAISRIFGLYLATGVVHKTWQLAQDPDNWLVWLAVDLAQGVLCVGAVVEIASTAFHRDVPGGRQQVAWRMLAALSIGLGCVVVWGVRFNPGNAGEFYDALVEVSRRLALTTLLLSTVLLGFVAKRWALDPWHRDILASLWLYNAALAVLSPRFGIALPLWWPVAVYSLLLAWWTWAAWRPDARPNWSPEFTRLVWPWRA